MGKGKKQQTTKADLGLTATNDLAPVKPLNEPIIEPKMKESRPKYAQQISADGDKKQTENGTTTATNDPKKKPKTGNNNYKRPYRRNYRPQFKAPEVKPLPDTMNSTEYKLSEEDAVLFSGPNHFLSALYPAQLKVDGNDYNSVEHYYQACKLFTLAGKEVAAMTKEASTPIEVKQLSKKLLKGKVSPKEVENWKKSDSISILKHAVYLKFEQNEDLKKKLLETDEKILIQSYATDNFFAAGANAKYCDEWLKKHNGETIKIPTSLAAENYDYLPIIANGKNVLGYVTMHVRDCLRHGVLMN